MLTALAIAATMCGAIASVGLFTLLIAGAPNSTPEFWAKLKMWMIITAAGGTAIVIAAVWLLVEGRPVISGLVGVTPVFVLFGLIAWVQATR